MTASASGRVPMMDLQAHHDPLMRELRDAMERVLASGSFILGREVEALEREVSEALDVPYAVGVSSGTDALLVSLMALGIGPGDRVVTSPFSFFATAGAIARLGAEPVFVDIEPDTFHLDARHVEKELDERTRAVLPVHLFGCPQDMRSLHAACERGRVAIVEDAAQAIGAHASGGSAVGVLGDLGCFSFFPSKNLGCLGDGGLVTSGDARLAEHVRVLRSHGAQPKYYHQHVGGNFRLDALQAAVLRVKLPYLRVWTEARRARAARYDRWLSEAGLGGTAVHLPSGPREAHVFNQYVVRVPGHRDALRAHLERRGISSAVYYPQPLHLQPCFGYLGYEPGSLPEAERACREVLALPMYPELDDGAQKRVVDTIAEYFG